MCVFVRVRCLCHFDTSLLKSEDLMIITKDFERRGRVPSQDRESV